MRPDTPQQYEYVTVENVTGKTRSFLVVRPWTQFFKPQQRKDMPQTFSRNITVKNITMDCENFFDVGTSDKYELCDFTFDHIRVSDVKDAFSATMIPGTKVNDVIINGKKR